MRLQIRLYATLLKFDDPIQRLQEFKFLFAIINLLIHLRIKNNDSFESNGMKENGNEICLLKNATHKPPWNFAVVFRYIKSVWQTYFIYFFQNVCSM